MARDADIVAARRNGESRASLARRHNLTGSRIGKIVADEAPELIQTERNSNRSGLPKLPPDFGPRLRLWLRAAGVKTEACAQKMGIRRTYLSSHLFNTQSPFPPHHVASLREFLGDDAIRFCMGQTNDLPILSRGIVPANFQPLPIGFSRALRTLTDPIMSRARLIVLLRKTVGLSESGAVNVANGQQSLGGQHLPALREAFGDEIIDAALKKVESEGAKFIRSYSEPPSIEAIEQIRPFAPPLKARLRIGERSIEINEGDLIEVNPKTMAISINGQRKV